MGVGYWPPGIPRQETLAAFEEAYGTIGFSPCQGSELEPGFRKIAIYADNGVPTHAARQLPDGRWTSKLGRHEDIEHLGLEVLEDGGYGEVALILRCPGPWD